MDTLNPGLAWRKRKDSTMARKRFPAGFRRDVVKLYRSTPGATVRIAGDLGVMDTTLSSWRSPPGAAAVPDLRRPDRSTRRRNADQDPLHPFRDRSLAEQAFPYVFLDATYCKARVNRRVVSRAVVIATGVAADGRREVLGCDVGDSENEVFWTDFLRGLRNRGLAGVQLVISDSHRGLTNAIGTVLTGASWQRCRVHFMRNVLARVTKGQAEMVAAAIRTIFASPHPTPSATPWAPSLTPWTGSSPPWRRCCATRARRSPPSPTSRKPTGARSGRPTRWNG